MSSPTDDLISCLCVTRNRVQLLERAVACFRQQTHANKELVIMFDADDAQTQAYVRRIESDAIRGVEVPDLPPANIGRKRNLSVKVARGPYVAVWDDDDWHAPDRLQEQLAAILAHGRPACVLARELIYDTSSNRAWVSCERPWENSLVARRDALPAYQEIERGGDTPLIDAMLQQERVVGLDRPDLYIYMCHGGNVWAREHWKKNIFAHATPLSEEDANKVREVLRDGLTL